MPTSRKGEPQETPASDGGTEKLSNFMCFAIYSANLAFGRAYKPLLDKLGLTYTQYVTMVALSEEDEQTVGALGEKLFLESNTLTPMLKKLESEGYLERRRDPADERQVRVTLTPAGRALIETNPGAALVGATGLGDDFASVQRSVAKMRDSLLQAAQPATAKR
ncbi:MarR family transcriptional regulator [Mycoplana sp. MJR14]|uniref:MarR family winged helix-turn-helix transcriptional regulator n=1 Tax=Mycoplana sp. MJR14 TaxID=3032583 RepID=UPI000DD8075D|nr:MarR family transcriptional regulator [Mycoplana sp. MJR14]MDF1631900.1 MarR family transcriptional regulator [Mycoplana sp. MJR14]